MGNVLIFGILIGIYLLIFYLLRFTFYSFYGIIGYTELLYHHFSLFGKQFTYGDALVILVLLAIIIWQVSIDIRWDKCVHKWDEEERK